MANLDEILAKAHDVVTVRRVYGEPYTVDGVTVIPAARVMGGGGGGEGDGGEEAPSGSGGGFGLVARPVGAYQVKDGELTWVPAADTTRVIIVGELVAIVALLVFRSVLRRRRKR